MVRSNYIVTIIISISAIYLFMPQEEQEVSLPPPSMQKVKRILSSTRKFNENRDNGYSQIENITESKKEINFENQNEEEKKKPSLFERITGLDEVENAKNFVLNFKVPKGEEYERQELGGGGYFTRSGLDDGTQIERKYRPDGSISVENYISEKLRILKIQFDDSALNSFSYENNETDEFISVNYGRSGEISHRNQRIDGLWFQQSFDPTGKPTFQEVIAGDTGESVTFDYFFKDKN